MDSNGIYSETLRPLMSSSGFTPSAVDGADRHLISVHFPKASGSSLLIAFQRAVGTENVLLDYAEDPADPRNIDRRRFRPLCGAPIQLQHRIVHGHFPIEKYSAVPNCYRVVLLRPPVENLISIYFYWKLLAQNNHQNHSIFESFKAERPTLLDFATHPVLRRLMSETYFGGCRMEDFDIIGDFSHREAYYRALSSLTQLEFDTSIRENSQDASEERTAVMSDRTTRAALERILSDDVRFFERWAGRGRVADALGQAMSPGRA